MVDGEDGQSKEAMLEQARMRLARINSYIDMIPSQYLLGYSNDLVSEEQRNQDPGAARRTSVLLVEAALLEQKERKVDKGKLSKLAKKQAKGTGAGAGAAGAQGGATDASALASGKKRKLQELTPVGSDDQSLRREALRQKLEARIAELKEERRKKQSEVDKQKAEAARAARAAREALGEVEAKKVETAKAEKPREKAAKKEEEEKQAKAPKSPKLKAAKAAEREEVLEGDEAAGAPLKVTNRPMQDVEEDIEVGRVLYKVKAGSLPFEATQNRRGAKAKRLREELRNTEQRQAKIQLAEERGEREGEQARKAYAMEKALLRAQGQKVHDDASKLRKVQTRLELKKKKSRERREQAVEETKRQQEERQTRRKENLAKRTAGKKKNQRRKGFEGLQEGYMNKES